MFSCSCSSRVAADLFVVLSASSSSSNNSSSEVEIYWKNFISEEIRQPRFLSANCMSISSSDSMRELRIFLNESVLLQSLLMFSSGTESNALILLWTDIQLSKSRNLIGLDEQRCTALEIFRNYLSSGGNNQVKVLDRFVDFDGFKDIIIRINNRYSISDVLNSLQFYCFSTLHQKLWPLYVANAQYQAALNTSVKERTDVSVDDFLYLEKIEERRGVLSMKEFGCTVHCMKLSNGKHYAMKIYKKTKVCIKQAMLGKDVTIKCRHRFMCCVDFALQTDEFLMLVEDIGRCMYFTFPFIYFHISPFMLYV